MSSEDADVQTGPARILPVMTKSEGRPSSGLSSPSRIATIPPTELGLKVITTVPPDISVDVVAVHGLGAIPSKTWVEKHSKVNWIEDEGMLPSDLPKARIMTFAYDSLWAGANPIKTDVRDIAESFLKSLIAEREDCPERPLIFIAHCFGGLVVQRMLLRANQRADTRHICEVTVGVVFLGTPHRGTGAFSNTGMIYAAIASNPGIRMEPGVLDIFRSDDSDLIPDAVEFVETCLENHITGCCFFEKRPAEIGRMLLDSKIKVGDLTSSSCYLS